MNKDLDRPMTKPGLADNAEESVKCPVCGRLIEIGMVNEYNDEEGFTVDCPVCHSQVDIEEAQQVEASNEGY